MVDKEVIKTHGGKVKKQYKHIPVIAVELPEKGDWAISKESKWNEGNKKMLKRLFNTLLIATLLVASFVGISPKTTEASTKIPKAAREKAEQMKKEGLYVNITTEERDGETITFVNGFSDTKSLEKNKGWVTTEGSIWTIDAKQYIYYGYKYVGEITGQLEVELMSSTSIKIRNYNLTPDNQDGEGVQINSVYYNPQVGNPAKLYYNFSFSLRTSYMETGYVPFHCIYYVYPTGIINFYNDASAK